MPRTFDPLLGTQPDAAILRRAAAILRERSSRPNGFGMRVMCKVLRGVADKIDDDA